MKLSAPLLPLLQLTPAMDQLQVAGEALTRPRLTIRQARAQLQPREYAKHTPFPISLLQTLPRRLAVREVPLAHRPRSRFPSRLAILSLPIHLLLLLLRSRYAPPRPSRQRHDRYQRILILPHWPQQHPQQPPSATPPLPPTAAATSLAWQPPPPPRTSTRPSGPQMNPLGSPSPNHSGRYCP